MAKRCKRCDFERQSKHTNVAKKENGTNDKVRVTNTYQIKSLGANSSYRKGSYTAEESQPPLRWDACSRGNQYISKYAEAAGEYNLYRDNTIHTLTKASN